MYEDIVLWAECRPENWRNDDTEICALSLNVLQVFCRQDPAHVSVLRPVIWGVEGLWCGGDSKEEEEV
jgi:hypothetical protein